jgi:hypothetical protein
MAGDDLVAAVWYLGRKLGDEQGVVRTAEALLPGPGLGDRAVGGDVAAVDGEADEVEQQHRGERQEDGPARAEVAARMLALAIASASSVNFCTVMTGPKTSFGMISSSCLTTPSSTTS